MANLEYQEISDTVHVRKGGDVEGGVRANGKLIVNKNIDIDSIGAYLKGGDKVFIDQKTFKYVRVSQEFYQEFQRSRTSLCAIIEGIEEGNISSSEGRARAERLYLDVIELFSGVTSDRRKSRDDSIIVARTGMNGQQAEIQSLIDRAEKLKNEISKGSEVAWGVSLPGFQKDVIDAVGRHANSDEHTFRAELMQHNLSHATPPCTSRACDSLFAVLELNWYVPFLEKLKSTLR